MTTDELAVLAEREASGTAAPTTSERLVLAELALIGSGTISSITRRLGADGRDVRVILDVLVANGEAEYFGGQGNNRSYGLVRR